MRSKNFTILTRKSKKVSYDNWSTSELIAEINKLKKRKKYGLVWDEETTKEVFEKESEKKLPIFKEITGKQVKNRSNTTNILIKGDNYHALSVLNYTHRGKIDAIYIDPPYNTGNNTWKYNNKYMQDDDPFKHSKWISFMHKRLKLARRLLTKKGIICVAIDNHEVHNLRHIMEEIFTDKEIIVTVIEHHFSGRAGNNFALTHEYVIWAINKNEDLITRLPEITDDKMRNLRRGGNNSRRSDSPTMFYGIEVDKKSLKIIGTTKPLKFDEPIPKHHNPKTEMVWPIDSKGVERNWYYSPERLLKEAAIGEAFAKKIKDSTQIRHHTPGVPKRRKSLWRGTKYNASVHGSQLLTEIIGENDFPFPKSIHAVKECINSMTDKKDAIILDFFAGSGTTGHAILELNKEDNGNRKFILCTNNEGNICNEITLPRLKNVMNGYSFSGKNRKVLFEKKITYTAFKKYDEISQQIEDIKSAETEFDKFEVRVKDVTLQLVGIKEIHGKKPGLGGNLKYFKTDFVNSESTDLNKKIISERSTEILCLKEDCFNKVNQTKSYSIFNNSDGKYLGIVYDDRGIDLLKKQVKLVDKKFIVYVFSLDTSGHEDEFYDVADLVSIRPIPEAILNTYRRICG